MNAIFSIDTLIIMHTLGSTDSDIVVEHDGVRWRLQIEIANMVPVPAVIVELYDRQSTSQNLVISPTAQTDLNEAIIGLLTSGVPFFTVPRSDWCLQAFRWHSATGA